MMLQKNDANAKPKKINVPTQYREGAKILKKIVEEGKSVKTLVYNNSHLRTGSMSKLIQLIQAHEGQLEEVITVTKLFEREKQLNPWLGRILVAELLFGRKQLNGFSKPVECVRKYSQELQSALANTKIEPKLQKQLKYNVPRYVRVNTIIYDRKDAIEYCLREGWRQVSNEFESYQEFLEAVKVLKDDEFIEDYHIRQLFVFPSSSKKYWSCNPLRFEGKFLLQEKASCLPTFMLAPPKKSTVLDMCAAPGMKTVHLAAIMKNKGKIYAVERDSERFKILNETVETSKASIVQTINDDVLKVFDNQVPGVEYILLDPSCSGSGMLNRFVEEDQQKDTDRLFKLSGLQYKLLYHAMTNFPKVKKIVYSTCSVFPEENEEVVLGALRHCKDFKLINACDLLGNYWKHRGSEKYPGVGENCIYAKTEDDLTIGFFVAVFIRCDDGEFNQFYLEKQERKRQLENLTPDVDSKTKSKINKI